MIFWSSITLQISLFHLLLFAEYIAFRYLISLLSYLTETQGLTAYFLRRIETYCRGVCFVSNSLVCRSTLPSLFCATLRIGSRYHFSFSQASTLLNVIISISKYWQATPYNSVTIPTFSSGQNAWKDLSMRGPSITRSLQALSRHIPFPEWKQCFMITSSGRVYNYIDTLNSRQYVMFGWIMNPSSLCLVNIEALYLPLLPYSLRLLPYGLSLFLSLLFPSTPFLLTVTRGGSQLARREGSSTDYDHDLNSSESQIKALT